MDGSGDPVLVLGPADVAALLDPPALLAALRAAFAAATRGEVEAPPRSELSLGGGDGLLVMPGRRAGGHAVVKHVGLFPGNPARGLPAHPATICAFDAGTGALRAVLDATELTAARTAAAAALAADLAARPDARVAAVIGSGPVAAAHLRFLPAVRALDELRIGARDGGAAAALARDASASPTRDADPDGRPRVVAAASIEAAVRGADLVCLCTSATTPLVRAEWLAPGAHLSSVGYAPPGGELDPALARAGRLLVETRDAFAPPPAGCAELAGIDPASAAELGEVVLGLRPGRTSDAELTVYKSMGTVVEDLAAAEAIIAAAFAR